jgi:hypothetical protein
MRVVDSPLAGACLACRGVGGSPLVGKSLRDAGTQNSGEVLTLVKELKQGLTFLGAQQTPRDPGGSLGASGKTFLLASFQCWPPPPTHTVTHLHHASHFRIHTWGCALVFVSLSRSMLHLFSYSSNAVMRRVSRDTKASKSLRDGLCPVQRHTLLHNIICTTFPSRRLDRQQSETESRNMILNPSQSTLASCEQAPKHLAGNMTNSERAVQGLSRSPILSQSSTCWYRIASFS